MGTIAIQALHQESRAQVLAAGLLPNAGATVVQDLILQPVTKTQTVGSLTGQVFRADGVTPVVGVPVYSSRGGVATTDATGAYRIDGLTTGEVLVRAIDQTLLEQGIIATTIVPDQTVTANILIVGGTGTINGVVLEADGAPAPGIKVYGGPSLVETDANGRFTLTAVPVGSVQLTAVDEGRERTAEKSVALTRPNETVSVQLGMPALGVLTGRIFQIQGGQPQPVPGLKIYALGPRIRAATTDANGAYWLENMPMGDYTISAFLPDLRDGNIVTGKLVFKDQVLRLDTVFKGKGQITGIVYDDDGVTPVGAKVGLTELQVKPGKLTPAENPLCLGATESGLPLPPCITIGVGYETVYRARRINNEVTSGRFTFNDVFVGDFTVEAASPFSPEAVAVKGVMPTVGASVPVTLALQATGAVSGTVYQPDGVTPVGADVIVQLDSAFIKNVRVQTDVQGRFSFPLVNPGGFTLTAEEVDAGLRGQTQGTVEAGQTAAFAVRLLRLGSVKVTVVGANGPVPGATVRLEQGRFPNTIRTGVTQADGAITFAGGDAIAEGDFGVQAAKEGIYGYGGGAIPPVPADGHVEVQVTLRNDAGAVQGSSCVMPASPPLPTPRWS